jgi:hypothetical protein
MEHLHTDLMDDKECSFIRESCLVAEVVSVACILQAGPRRISSN